MRRNSASQHRSTTSIMHRNTPHGNEHRQLKQLKTSGRTSTSSVLAAVGSAVVLLVTLLLISSWGSRGTAMQKKRFISKHSRWNVPSKTIQRHSNKNGSRFFFCIFSPLHFQFMSFIENLLSELSTFNIEIIENQNFVAAIVPGQYQTGRFTNKSNFVEDLNRSNSE